MKTHILRVYNNRDGVVFSFEGSYGECMARLPQGIHSKVYHPTTGVDEFMLKGFRGKAEIINRALWEASHKSGTQNKNYIPMSLVAA